MSERLERELKKVKFAHIEQVNENTYVVKKDVKIRLLEDNCYLIKLNDSIFDHNNILTTNWNNGKIPNSRYYQIDINKIMGNMIKVSSVGYDDETCTNFKENWWGWLPIDEIEVIKKI